MSVYRTPKQFREEFHYGRSTLAKWLPGMRADGVASGYGKATRINVERAKMWITEHTRPKSPPPMPYVFYTETLQ